MPDRAVAVVIDGDAIVVMHRSKDGSEYYALPGGGIEDGEFIAQACVRELREETGLDGHITRKLMVLHNRGRTEHYFLVTADRRELHLGGPEAIRGSESNRYTPMWLPLSNLARVDLRLESARLALLRHAAAPR